MKTVKISESWEKYRQNYAIVYNIGVSLVENGIIKKEDFNYELEDIFNLDYKEILVVKTTLQKILKGHNKTIKEIKNVQSKFEDLNENSFIKYESKKREYLMPIKINRGVLPFCLFHFGKEKIGKLKYTVKHPYKKRSMVSVEVSGEYGVPQAFEHNLYYATKAISERQQLIHNEQNLAIYSQKKIAQFMSLSQKANSNLFQKSLKKLYKSDIEKITETIDSDGEIIRMEENFRFIANFTYVSIKKAKYLTGHDIEVTDGSNKVFIVWLDKKGLDMTVGEQFVETEMMYIRNNDFVKTRLYQILQLIRHENYGQQVVYDIQELSNLIPLDMKNKTDRNNTLRKAFFKLQDAGYLIFDRIDVKTNMAVFRFPPKSYIDGNKFLDKRLEKTINENIEIIKNRMNEHDECEPTIIDIEPTQPDIEKIENEPKMDKPKNIIATPDKRVEELYKNVITSIGQVSRTRFDDLINKHGFEIVELYYINTKYKIDNNMPMKTTTGYFISSVENRFVLEQAVETAEKEKKERSAKEKIANEIKEFNLKNANNPDLAGSKNGIKTDKNKKKLLEIFTKDELNNLIEIGLEDHKKLGGVYAYNARCEVIDGISEMIYQYSGEEKDRIKEFKSVLYSENPFIKQGFEMPSFMKSKLEVVETSTPTAIPIVKKLDIDSYEFNVIENASYNKISNYLSKKEVILIYNNFIENSKTSDLLFSFINKISTNIHQFRDAEIQEYEHIIEHRLTITTIPKSASAKQSQSTPVIPKSEIKEKPKKVVVDQRVEVNDKHSVDLPVVESLNTNNLKQDDPHCGNNMNLKPKSDNLTISINYENLDEESVEIVNLIGKTENGKKMIVDFIRQLPPDDLVSFKQKVAETTRKIESGEFVDMIPEELPPFVEDVVNKMVKSKQINIEKLLISKNIPLPDSNYKITGEILKEAREKVRMSTRDLGKLIGSDHSSIVRWEKNERTVPKKYISIIRLILKI